MPQRTIVSTLLCAFSTVSQSVMVVPQDRLARDRLARDRSSVRRLGDVTMDWDIGMEPPDLMSADLISEVMGDILDSIDLAEVSTESATSEKQAAANTLEAEVSTESATSEQQAAANTLEHTVTEKSELDDQDAHSDRSEMDLRALVDANLVSGPAVIAYLNGTSPKSARGMLMKLEVKHMVNGTEFYVRFDHGCKPNPNKVVVNCIFPLGDKVKYMWAFRGPNELAEGDQMVMSLQPRAGTHAHTASFSKHMNKAFTGRCPACGQKCRTKYGDMKMELPTTPCHAPMDVGFHTLYRIPKDMPDITFNGRTKMQSKDGGTITDLSITWSIGSVKRLIYQATQFVHR